MSYRTFTRFFSVALLLIAFSYAGNAQNGKPATAVSPGWADTYMSAMRYYNNSDWNNAIPLFKKAIKIKPSERSTYLYLLNAHLHKVKDYDQAKYIEYFRNELKFFNALITSQPGTAIFYSARSSYYAVLGDQSASLQDMTAAINSNPADSFFYFKRGLIYQTKFAGMDDLALTDYKKAIDRGYKDDLVYVAIDTLYRKTKTKKELIKALDELVDLTSRKEAMPYVLLGKAYEENGNLSMASVSYDRADKLNPTPAIHELALATARKLIEEVGKSINTSSAHIANTDSLIKAMTGKYSQNLATPAASNSNRMAPKVETDHTCAACGGSGVVPKYGTHLAYVPVKDSQGRTIYNEYRTVEEFYSETCRRCGGRGRL